MTKQDSGFTLSFLLWHPVVWFLTTTVVAIFFVNAIWKDRLLALLGTEKYLLTENSLNINQPPPWLQNPVAQTKSRFLSKPRSLLNTSLVNETKHFLDAYPWIRQIDRIQKESTGMQVNLRYRTPVAFVDAGPANREVLIPVDGDGQVFDSNLVNRAVLHEMKRDLLRIRMPKISSTGIRVWQNWPDNRISAAVKLCEFLASDTEPMKLLWVISRDNPTELTGENPQFEILTLETKIFWGSAPGFEQAHEASATAKIESLRQLAHSAGKLSELTEDGDMMIDVSSGSPTLIPAPRYSNLPDRVSRIR
ncbi:MAG: hypothetical protein AAGA30_18140 [Planctomycetota bacterium]